MFKNWQYLNSIKLGKLNKFDWTFFQVSRSSAGIMFPIYMDATMRACTHLDIMKLYLAIILEKRVTSKFCFIKITSNV